LPQKGKAVRATTVNLSGCGVLLHFREPVQIAVGDELICEFKVRHRAGKSLPCWGVGHVVRIDGTKAAVELSAGGYNPADPASGDSFEPDAA
jgi:hypothetical protein